MNQVELQFEALKLNLPNATLQPLQDGTYLVSIPDIQLPDGWSRSTIELKFLTPIGYPIARPDCFWTDGDLRLANGNMPQNAQPNPNPPVLSGYLWFSWHLSTWSPNSDTLLTYVNVIKNRFRVPQ